MSVLPTVALYASKQEIQNAHELLFNPHICIRCNNSFNLAENLGNHKCYQHPGEPINGKWSCCGNPVYNLFYSKHFKVDSMYSCSTNMAPYPPPIQARGCQPCDHTIFDKKWNYKDTERLHKIAGLIPFLNKISPLEERPGFCVVKINSQKMPVMLRCSRKWVHWPKINEDIFEDEYMKNKETYLFENIEINYISLGGENIQLLYTQDQWSNLQTDSKWNQKLNKLDIKGTLISAFCVYKTQNAENQIKIQVYELII